jgi:steroid delta-isomerase-like uncharacterized protein
MTNSNKKVVEDFYSEVINKKNLNLIYDLLTDDFTHNGVQRGAEGQKQVVESFFTAFPDINSKIEFIFEQGDDVAIHETWTGTHKGEFMNVKPSGKFITWKANALFRIKNGKIAIVWDLNDFLSVFQQIGSYPPIPNTD